MFSSRRLLLAVGFTAALIVTVFFGMRVFHQLAPLQHPKADEQIRPWMNVPYIADSYDVPPEVLYQALGLPPDPPDPRPIGRIAREQNRSFGKVREDLMDAIKEARTPPEPPPQPPEPGARGEP